MPTLHELFDAASGDLPPLPDLAPTARRIVRRKQLAARMSAAVLSSALVVGAGTFALAVQQSGDARDAAGSPPQAFTDQYVLDTLRGLWPDKNEHLSLGSSGGVDVWRNNKTVAFVTFDVLADVANFPNELTCPDWMKDCRKATASDGDEVIVRTDRFKQDSAASQIARSSVAPSPSSSPLPVGLSTAADGMAARLHGTYFGRLMLNSSDDGQLTADQLLGIVESPAYAQLIESAVAASSLDWFGTPPNGYPTGTASPSASAYPATPSPGIPSATASPWPSTSASAASGSPSPGIPSATASPWPSPSASAVSGSPSPGFPSATASPWPSPSHSAH
jgi:hypothetical protein